MRKLQTADVFNAMRMIKKANLKEEIKPYLMMAASGEVNVEEVGIEGVLGLIETMSEQKIESAIYEVLAGPFEMTADEVAKMDLDKMIECLETLGKENNLKVFFKSLSGLIGKK